VLLWACVSRMGCRKNDFLVKQRDMPSSSVRVGPLCRESSHILCCSEVSGRAEITSSSSLEPGKVQSFAASTETINSPEYKHPYNDVQTWRCTRNEQGRQNKRPTTWREACGRSGDKLKSIRKSTSREPQGTLDAKKHYRDDGGRAPTDKLWRERIEVRQ